jgi:hypothetical protein
MDTLLQDIRFAFRSLRRSPGLVLVATLSLALGIAVNVTIYAAVDILLLRPQPFEEPHRLMQVWSPTPREDGMKPASPGRFPGLAIAEPDHVPVRVPEREFQSVGR